MRRVSKPWPPKNVSPDDQSPCTLQQFEQDLLKKLPFAEKPAKLARTTFDSLDKRKLREVLYAEQRKLCVYCEQRVDEGPSAPHPDVPPIDHWRPLKENPELALNWSNLYLSCPNDGTCDDAKHEQPLGKPDLPWPTDADYHHWIGFTRGGEAYVRTDAPIDAQVRNALEQAIGRTHAEGEKHGSVLALNQDGLIAARRAAIEAEWRWMEKNFPRGHASREQRHARATALLKDKPYPTFVSTRVAWYLGLLGKHKPPTP